MVVGPKDSLPSALPIKLLLPVKGLPRLPRPRRSGPSAPVLSATRELFKVAVKLLYMPPPPLVAVLPLMVLLLTVAVALLLMPPPRSPAVFPLMVMLVAFTVPLTPL